MNKSNPKDSGRPPPAPRNAHGEDGKFSRLRGRAVGDGQKFSRHGV